MSQTGCVSSSWSARYRAGRLSHPMRPGSWRSSRLLAVSHRRGGTLAHSRPEYREAGHQRSDFRQTIYEDEEVDVTGRALLATLAVVLVLGLAGWSLVRRRRRAA